VRQALRLNRIGHLCHEEAMSKTPQGWSKASVTTRRVVLLVLCAVGLLSGCRRDAAWLDERDLSEPLVQKARAKEREGDQTGAIELYAKALEHNPLNARAHMDIAVLLQQIEKDYVSAIYHYRRYLELRPETEKVEMIEERIRLAEQMLVTQLQPAWQRVQEEWSEETGQEIPASIPTVDTNKIREYEDRIATLRQESESLKRRITDLTTDLRDQKAQVQRLTSALASARSRSTPKPEPRDTGLQRVVRTHRVRRGDSLSRIAKEVYGDANAWERIYQANRDVLGGENKLRVGQVLIIP